MDKIQEEIAMHNEASDISERIGKGEDTQKLQEGKAKLNEPSDIPQKTGKDEDMDEVQEENPMHNESSNIPKRIGRGEDMERLQEENATLDESSGILKREEVLGDQGKEGEGSFKLDENTDEKEALHTDEKFTAMVEQNRTFMANNKKLRKLVKDLEEDINARGKENALLENRNKALDAQVHKLINQVQDLNEDIALLNNTLKEARGVCDKYMDMNKTLEADVDRLNKEMGAKEGENTTTNRALKQEMVRLDESLKTVNEEKEKLAAEKKELLRDKNDLYQEVEQNKIIIKNISEEATRVSETNKRLETEKNEEMEQLALMTEQNKSLEEKLEYLNEKLSTGLQEEIDNILSLGHYQDTQGKKYVIVENDVETKWDEELKVLQEQVKQLQDDKKSLEQLMENTNVQKKILSEKLNKLNEEKAKVENSIVVLRKEKEHIEMELRLDNQKLKSDFLTMLKDIEEKLAAKVKESDAIDEEKETLTQELAKLTDSKKKLEMEIDIMENVIGKQVKKIDGLLAKCYSSKELEHELQSKTQLIEGLYEENDILRREAEYKDEEVEEVSRKCEMWVALVEERVHAYDILKEKYIAQQGFVKRASNILFKERAKKNMMNDEILHALKRLDLVVSSTSSHSSDHIFKGSGSIEQNSDTRLNTNQSSREKIENEAQHNSSILSDLGEVIPSYIKPSGYEEHSTSGSVTEKKKLYPMAFMSGKYNSEEITAAKGRLTKEQHSSINRSSPSKGCLPNTQYSTTSRTSVPERRSSLSRRVGRARSLKIDRK